MAQDALIHGVNVCFNVPGLNLLALMAKATFQGQRATARLEGIRRRKLDLPEIQVRIHKGHTINVAVRLTANLTDKPYLSFFR
jgi:hypothetical protein